VFPFKYGRITYTTCSNKFKNKTNNLPWCSTKVDEKGKHVGGGGNWGNCDETCPSPPNDNSEEEEKEEIPETSTSVVTTSRSPNDSKNNKLEPVKVDDDYNDNNKTKDEDEENEVPGQRSSACLAVGGPGNGLPCVFPFKYGRITYTTCSNKFKNKTNNLPWCSTKVDEKGKHVGGGGNWGNCDETCPSPPNDNSEEEEKEEIPEGVSCGGHRVNSCSECNVEFKDWCNGDCTLCDDSCVLTSESNCTLPTTVPQVENIQPQTITQRPKRPKDQVNCGGHVALSCSECNADFADWCNGDCNFCKGSCVLTSESNCNLLTEENPIQPLTSSNDGVNCGGHRANSCSECDLEFSDWCNGDCTLCNDSCILISESNCTVLRTDQIQPQTTTSSTTTSKLPPTPPKEKISPKTTISTTTTTISSTTTTISTTNSKLPPRDEIPINQIPIPEASRPNTNIAEPGNFVPSPSTLTPASTTALNPGYGTHFYYHPRPRQNVPRSLKEGYSRRRRKFGQKLSNRRKTKWIF